MNFFGFNIAFNRKSRASNNYEAARSSAARGEMQGSVGDAGYEFQQYVRMRTIKTCRALANNDGNAAEIIANYELYAVGDGIRPQAMTSDLEWNKAAEKFFAQWAHRCEITGRFSFWELQKLASRALDTDGEIIFLKSERGGLPSLVPVEAHRLVRNATDSEIDGITIDDDCTPIKYTIDSGESAREFPAEYVIHCLNARRATYVHGVPTLVSAANALIDARELLGLEKKALKTLANFAGAIESNRDVSNDFVVGGTNGCDTATGQTDASAIQKIVGGRWFALKTGEKATPLNPNRPSNTFDGFYDKVVESACGGVQPYSFVFNLNKTGPAIRAEIGKADRYFSARQDVLIRHLCEPVWYWVILWAMLNGRLPLNEHFNDVEWQTPKKLSVDLGREAQQDREDVRGGFNSLTNYYGTRGMNAELELDQVAKETVMMSEIEKKYGLAPGTLLERVLAK